MATFIKAVIAFALVAGTTACSSTKQSTSMTSTGDNAANGWSPLFDGKSLVGWHSYGTKTAGSWRALNGAITLDTSSGSTRQRGDLVSNEAFENYHLSLEWKLAPGGNSGIIFNVQDDAVKYRNTYETGPEMQVLDNERHSDAKIPKHRAGDLYDLIASSKETVKPAGQWNTAEIIKNKDSLTLRLNGTTVVQTKMFDDNWKQMLANSKFKEWKSFGTINKGVIALQDHGDKVMYRNIKLRKL